MEGGGSRVSIMALLVKERGREARPASFVEGLSGVCICYMLTDADDSMEWNGPAPLPCQQEFLL